MPDGFSDTPGTQIDLLLACSLQGEIFRTYRERVTASSFGRDSQYDFVVTKLLRCHLEVEHAVWSQVYIIGSTRQDRDAGVC